MPPFLASILQSIEKTLAAGLVLVVVVIILFGLISGAWIRLDGQWWFDFVFRWLHIFFGILWIGILYYFNFVQTPSMPKIPAEQRPAITKVIAPEALFYFRWAALLTVVTGLIVAIGKGYFVNAITLGIVKTGVTGAGAIGLGMWLGLIMAFNVWFIIWPNQQKALSLTPTPVSDADKATAGRIAGQASRINFMLSIPMLFCMAAQSHGGL
jgi:uncharacterized membrane protein